MVIYPIGTMLIFRFLKPYFEHMFLSTLAVQQTLDLHSMHAVYRINIIIVITYLWTQKRLQTLICMHVIVKAKQSTENKLYIICPLIDVENTANKLPYTVRAIQTSFSHSSTST